MPAVMHGVPVDTGGKILNTLSVVVVNVANISFFDGHHTVSQSRMMIYTPSQQIENWNEECTHTKIIDEYL